MAVRADLETEVRTLGGPRDPGGAAGAVDVDDFVFGMNSRFHGAPRQTLNLIRWLAAGQERGDAAKYNQAYSTAGSTVALTAVSKNRSTLDVSTALKTACLAALAASLSIPAGA